MGLEMAGCCCGDFAGSGIGDFAEEDGGSGEVRRAGGRADSLDVHAGPLPHGRGSETRRQKEEGSGAAGSPPTGRFTGRNPDRHPRSQCDHHFAARIQGSFAMKSIAALLAFLAFSPPSLAQNKPAVQLPANIRMYEPKNLTPDRAQLVAIFVRNL